MKMITAIDSRDQYLIDLALKKFMEDMKSDSRRQQEVSKLIKKVASMQVVQV